MRSYRLKQVLSEIAYAVLIRPTHGSIAKAFWFSIAISVEAIAWESLGSDCQAGIGGVKPPRGFNIIEHAFDWGRQVIDCNGYRGT